MWNSIKAFYYNFLAVSLKLITSTPNPPVQDWKHLPAPHIFEPRCKAWALSFHLKGGLKSTGHISPRFTSEKKKSLETSFSCRLHRAWGREVAALSLFCQTRENARYPTRDLYFIILLLVSLFPPMAVLCGTAPQVSNWNSVGLHDRAAVPTHSHVLGNRR